MNMTCIPRGLALAVALVASSGAFAATALRPLSDSEMSDVHAQGLSAPALMAFGALSASEQSDSSVPASTAAALSGLASMSGDLQNLDRQLAQQRLQAAQNGVQATIMITQTLLAADRAAAPIALTLPLVGFPLLGLPTLAALADLPHKH